MLQVSEQNQDRIDSDNNIFPISSSSLIMRHSVAEGMNLSFSCNKSSGLGESTVVSPYVEFMYMACNPWKFVNITVQGRAESLMRLKQIYSEYSEYFREEKECIDALTHLIYTTLDTFTRRERLHITERLFATGLLAQCFGGHSFTVMQGEDLAFKIHYMGKEHYLLSVQEQKEYIHSVYLALSNNSATDLMYSILMLGKQEHIDYVLFENLVEEVYAVLDEEIKEMLPFGAISKDILSLIESLVSLIHLVPKADSELITAMYSLLSIIRNPLVAYTGDEVLHSIQTILGIPWKSMMLLGVSGILSTEYAFGVTALRYINTLAELEKNIVEEKSILWVLNSLELCIDAGNIEYDTAIEEFLYALVKTLPVETIEAVWKRFQKEDYKQFLASFAFAYNHTNNEVCQRIYFFLSYLVHTFSRIVSEEQERAVEYEDLWAIDEQCLAVLAQYGVHVEEVYLLHRLREVVELLAKDASFSDIEEEFFRVVTAFGEQYYKALTESHIEHQDKRQQLNWCNSLFHRVLHIYGVVSKANIQAKLVDEACIAFKEKHTFLSSSEEGSTWFGSWAIMEVLTEYATGVQKMLTETTEEGKAVSSSIFSRKVRKGTLDSSELLDATQMKKEQFVSLAEKCTESSEGIHLIRKNLTDMNVSQDIMIGTYLRVAVQNTLISPEEALEIYTNLHKTEGVDIPLFKVNLSNTLQLKGHLHEIRMASTAAMFGFDVYAMNKLYRVDADRLQYEVDILMKKYGKTIGIEVKDLSDTKGTNFKDILEAVEKMGAFKRYQGDSNTFAMLTQTGRPPSQDKLAYLDSVAQNVGVQVLYGGIREQLLQIDSIVRSKNM